MGKKTGYSTKLLQLICNVAAWQTKALSCALIEIDRTGEGEVWAATQSILPANSSYVAIPNLNCWKNQTIVINNLMTTKWFESHPLREIAPFAQSLVVVSLPIADRSRSWYLALFFSKPVLMKLDVDYKMLAEVTALMRKLLKRASTSSTLGQELYKLGLT
ncbi:MAG: hypothetical protein M3O03_04105 [Pseudomonadota bacterium]|nr:hypothetical protein [Pseudomonadota bacterium]